MTAVLDRSRLQTLLGGPATAWLRDRVRTRLARGQALSGVVTLSDPSDAERAAVDRLLGRRPSSGASVTVRLEDVDRLLREARVCAGLAAAVEALDGPAPDPDRAAAEEAAWRRAVGSIDPDRLGPWARGWVDDLEATGVLRRLAGDPTRARELMRTAAAVLEALPGAGVPRARLAAEVVGDSHGLDPGPLATLVLKGLQHRRDGRAGALPGGEERRALWASAGVLVGELSSSVLVLGLPGPRASGLGRRVLQRLVRGPGMRLSRDPSMTDRVLAAHAAAGEPARLTLGQLVRHPPQLHGLAGRQVYVCENTAVVAAAAAELGPACPPLVCVEGQPSSAGQALLASLAGVGAALAYHGDFDWAGLRIGNLLVEQLGARPWRFTAADYRAAPGGPPLSGSPVEAAWDVALAGTLRDRGVAVHEEQVLDDLLADLAG